MHQPSSTRCTKQSAKTTSRPAIGGTDLQQREPRSKGVAYRVHAANYNSALFCIRGADLVGPSIDDGCDAISGSRQEECKELEASGNVPDGQDDAGRDIQASRHCNQGHLGVISVRQDAAYDGRDYRHGRRHRGNGVDCFDAVSLLLEPQCKPAVGRDTICLREEEGKGYQDPKVPAHKHRLDHGKRQWSTRLAVLGRHALLSDLDLSRGEEIRLGLVRLARQREKAQDSHGNRAGEAYAS